MRPNLARRWDYFSSLDIFYLKNFISRNPFFLVIYGFRCLTFFVRLRKDELCGHCGRQSAAALRKILRLQHFGVLIFPRKIPVFFGSHVSPSDRVCVLDC